MRVTGRNDPCRLSGNHKSIARVGERTPRATSFRSASPMPDAPLVHVVDDDEFVRESFRCLLESDGLWVEIHRSAREFLQSYREDCPACLLIDLRMPEMDGLQLQEELERRGVNIPIVFMSGCGDVPECALAMKRGAVDFLEKPIEYERLRDAVRSALEPEITRHLAQPNPSEVASRVSSLTRREQEVMRLLYQGNAPKNIASTLGIAFQTVAKHRACILKKLRVRNDAELVHLLTGCELRDEMGGDAT